MAEKLRQSGVNDASDGGGDGGGGGPHSRAIVLIANHFVK